VYLAIYVTVAFGLGDKTANMENGGAMGFPGEALQWVGLSKIK
jgi:hypothetical protein